MNDTPTAPHHLHTVSRRTEVLIAAATALTVTTLTACGGGTSPGDSGSNTSTTTPDVFTPATVTSTASPVGTPVTITTSDGFRYQLAAGPPTSVPQYNDSGGHTPVVAAPGTDFIKVPIALTNLQKDRAAPIDVPLATLNFYVGQAAAPAFSHRDPLGLDSVTCSKDASASTPPGGVCAVERGDYDAAPFAFRENGDPISIGFSEAPIGPGQTVNVAIYTYQVASGAPLKSLLLYAHIQPHLVPSQDDTNTQVPLP